MKRPMGGRIIDCLVTTHWCAYWTVGRRTKRGSSTP